ncbi:MAG TPA: sugar ABC transporter substrate-binding protein [Chloroflexota bacterium]|jgi:multiple sugar transport system substrate-binding protein|nr:sugar ABC transporter substrate-binding protein [Chloroflexota bacterium]
MPRSCSRRSLLAGLAALSGGAVLAACAAPAPPPTSTPAPAKPAEKPADKPAAEPTKPATAPQAAAPAAAKSGVTIRYHARTGSEADTLADRLPEFTQRTGVEVKAETFPGGEYYQKMQALIAGAQLGDVFWGALGIGWPIWGATGIMRPLDDFVQQEKFDTSNYYKVAIDQLYHQGKLYGLPFKLQPAQVGLYYNADQVKEAGVKEPNLNMTYDDLVEIAKGLTKRSGNRVERFGFLPYWAGQADVQGGWYIATVYARAWGAELMDEEGKKSLVTEPKFKEAIKWLHDLVFQHKAAPSYKEVPNNDPDQMFVAANGAMFQSGSWTKSVPTRIKDKFVVKDTLMPKGPSGKRGAMAIADLVGVNAKTQYPKEAWELTKHLTDKETGIRLGEGRGGASGTSGGRTDVFRDDRLMKNPLHPVWIEAVENAPGPRYTANFRTQEYNTALWQKLIALFIGDEAFGDKFFQELNQALQQVLDQPKP